MNVFGGFGMLDLISTLSTASSVTGGRTASRPRRLSDGFQVPPAAVAPLSCPLLYLAAALAPGELS